MEYLNALGAVSFVLLVVGCLVALIGAFAYAVIVSCEARYSKRYQIQVWAVVVPVLFFGGTAWVLWVGHLLPHTT